LQKLPEKAISASFYYSINRFGGKINRHSRMFGRDPISTGVPAAGGIQAYFKTELSSFYNGKFKGL
jgi:hypothetical protein